ncbi:hypothetical protein GKE62_10695 [Novosphingobium sp. Gsoil 351]|nr:hypothetical protein GKE62_10695 [Novosphingobium sp. Gsoil 351]
MPAHTGGTIRTMSGLGGLVGTDGAYLDVLGYHETGDGGGGRFVWNAAALKRTHDGGTVIDPQRAFPDDWDDQLALEAWFADGPAGCGLWHRVSGRGAVEAVWFGLMADYDPATGHGTDDAQALNRALSRHHTVRLPLGNILIRSRSVNMALKPAGSVLEGAGSGKVYGAHSGTVLWGETGAYPVIDRIGSQRTVVRGLSVCSGRRNPSLCGIADRRAQSSQYAQFNVLDNVDIDIVSSPQAYGRQGSIGWLNHSAELASVVTPGYWKADTALAFTNTDFWKVPSQFAEQGGPPSCSALTIHGPLTCHSYNPVGAPVRLHNAAAVTAIIYTSNQAVAGGEARAGTCGFRLSGANFAHQLTIFAEGCESAGEIEYLEAVTLRIRGIFGPGKVLRSTGQFQTVNRSEIHFEPTAFGSVAQRYWVEGPAGDAWSESTVIAPVIPIVDFVQAANRSNLSFVASGERRETGPRKSSG